METKRWNEQTVEEARDALVDGDVVAIPTETVYGLGADARNEEAVQKIFAAKGRPADNPLIIHLANKEQMSTYVQDVPPYVDGLMSHFSPGPITYVLPSSGKVAPAVTAGLDTVAVRIPDHPVAQKLLELCDFPVAAPSANLSGKPSPTKAAHVLHDMQGKIAGVIDGGNARSGLESTVVDCTGDIPIVLRPGEITSAQIKSVVGEVMIADKKTAKRPKSPGMKYKHYAPEVPLSLYIGYNEQEIEDIIKAAHAQKQRVGILSFNPAIIAQSDRRYYFIGQTHEEIAHHLYDRLRAVSKEDVDILLCHVPNKATLSEAILDRLTRAATTVYSH